MSKTATKDHAEIAVTDLGNSSKVHVWKREKGLLYYQQHICGENYYPETEDQGGGTGWFLVSREDKPECKDTVGYYWAYLLALKTIVTPGRYIIVDRNQADRDALVLAVDYEKGQALVEYVMPQGAVYMNIVPFDGSDIDASGLPHMRSINQTFGYRAVSAKALSKRWRALLPKEGSDACPNLLERLERLRTA